MGRFNMRLRPIYGENEQTGPEKFQQAVQGGLDWYAGRRETARQEGNTVGAAGGTRLPDEARPGIRERVRGIGTAIGDAIHGRGPGLPHPQIEPILRPTGTFAPSYPQRPGAQPMDERLDPYGNADDMVTDAILRRSVQPSPPIGALPPSPRPEGPLGAPSIGADNGMPTITPAAPERTYQYEGSDGARYELPQTGERERTNKMLAYEREVALKEAADDRNDARTSERSLQHDQRMVDYYDRRDERRGTQQAQHDARVAEMKRNLARLTGAGRGNSPEALAIRKQLADLAERKENRITEQGAAGLDARTAATEQRGVVTDPSQQRRLKRIPGAADANAQRQQRVDAAIARARETANRSRNRVADKPMAAKRAKELQTEGHTPADIRKIMQAEGYKVQ